MNKDLTKIADLTKQDLTTVLERAWEFKAKAQRGIRFENLLPGRVVAMVFEKPSLRTKVAFEVATTSLGGTPIFLSSSQILASGANTQGRESIADIARNLERFSDMIIARVYHHTVIKQIAESISKPVINALCDMHHPTQALADMMAIRWHKGAYPGLKVAFIGDGNNVATSLMQACALLGMDFAIASPTDSVIPKIEQQVAAKFASESGAKLSFLSNPQDAVLGADVVYADTFVSMGQEGERAQRLRRFDGYQVNAALMSLAKKDAVFMHCLPAHRGEEVTDQVMDSQQSIVFDQAECRLHIAKALLSLYL